jgi:hypothetical protein
MVEMVARSWYPSTSIPSGSRSVKPCGPVMVTMPVSRPQVAAVSSNVYATS